MPSAQEHGKEKTTQNGGSRQDFNDAFQSWQSFYTQMTNEGMEMFKQSLDIAEKMAPFSGNMDVFQKWTDNYVEFVGQAAKETSENPTDRETYQRIYERWLSLWSENLERYMRTPEFSAQRGKDIETFSVFQKKMGEMLESYWQSMHLPTSSDMQEVYFKLYNIDRKLDDLNNNLRQLQQTLDSAEEKTKKSKEK